MLIPGFARGWTHIVSANDGSLLFYNAATGRGRDCPTRRRRELSVRECHPRIRARDGLTIAGASNGSVLFYNASTGDGATARLDSAGNYQFVSAIPGFARGWTQIAG